MRGGFRRLLQFRLLTILVLTTITCVALAFHQGYLSPYARQWEAREQVRRLGGSVDLRPAEPRWMRSLLGEDRFQDVTMIHLENRYLTNEDLTFLTSVPHVERLYLAGNRMERGGLKSVRAMHDLRRLSLWYTQLEDQDVIELLRYTPALEALDLHGTQITDRTVEVIATLPRLQYLNLGGTSISEQALQRLRSVRTLRHLSLYRSTLGAESWRALSQLTQLEALDLRFSNVHRIPPGVLSRLPRLRQLDVGQCYLPEHAVNELIELRSLETLFWRPLGSNVARLIEQRRELTIDRSARH